MSIYPGGESIESIYIGSDKVARIYQGSDLIYESEPWYTSDMSGYRYGVINGNTTVVDKGVYDNKYLDIPNSTYCIVDSQAWYNNLSNKISNLNNCNYVGCIGTNGDIPLFFQNGNLYTVYQYNNVSERLTGGWIKSFGNAGDNKGVYAVKNKEIYKIIFNTGNNPTVNSTSKVMNFNSSVIPPDDENSVFVIIDNNLYKGARSSSLTLMDSGGWTDMNYNGNGAIGIKNGNLYKLLANNVTLLNNSKTWVSVSPTRFQDLNSYFISENGVLGSYRAGLREKFEIEPFANSNNLRGRWESFGYGCGGLNNGILIIRNGALYVINSDNTITLIDDRRYYTKCAGDYNFGIAVSSGNRILA